MSGASRRGGGSEKKHTQASSKTGEQPCRARRGRVCSPVFVPVKKEKQESQDHRGWRGSADGDSRAPLITTGLIRRVPPPLIFHSQNLEENRLRAGAETIKHGCAQDGRGPLQQHTVLVGRRPSRAFVPDAGAEGRLRLRAAALHLPGPAHRALLPHPAGSVPQHALVQLD
ncbi:hypothetical protein OJAV_G00163700 [Xyrichtys novacula]|uniref:Uncharacterized protein n=1 Tax=Xyrichtys novacula TaxID=13765 RepID=A0AAV1FS01_XYRNO|nr:hypothetical protein OJAV_G00163700 [Xyrichtys novacula]